MMEALITGNIIFCLGLLITLGKWVYSIDRRLAQLENQLMNVVKILEADDG